MKTLRFALLSAVVLTSSAVMAQDGLYAYQNDLKEAHDATVVGGGTFVADETFGTVFQNVATTPRSNYLLLPEQVFQHSGETKALSIGVWVSADGVEDDNSYCYAPLFSGYAAKAEENSWPMMVLQTRGLAQVNCWGWCDFTPAQNVKGVNTLYHPNAFIQEGDATFVHGENWLADHKWHYYTAVFTTNSCTIYFDGQVANQWQFEPGDGAWIDGLLVNKDDQQAWLIKYICLGGNQAWNWADNDAPFKFANLLITNKALTAEDVAAQMVADMVVDGVETVKADRVADGVRYNLAGQKVGADYKGVVIENGKKMMVK